MSNHFQQNLLSAAQALLQEETDVSLAREADPRFIELVTWSQPETIISMLDTVLETSFIEFPVWARNLAFRLAVLQRPHDTQLLRRAGADLKTFGPDWDAEAEALLQRADAIDKEGC